MVLMNLFSGHQWRHRCREQIYGHGQVGEGEGGTMEKVEWKHIQTLPCVK